jgi:hypothetical protein
LIEMDEYFVDPQGEIQKNIKDAFFSNKEYDP